MAWRHAADLFIQAAMITSKTLIAAAIGVAIGLVVFGDIGLGIVIGIVTGGAAYASKRL